MPTPADSIVYFRSTEIAPMDIGVPIAKDVMVVDSTEVSPLIGDARTIYSNATINFPLELPGSAGVVESSADWGLGVSGISADGFWSRGVYGQAVRIGIADSGLDISSQSLSSFKPGDQLIAFAGFNGDGSKQIQHDPTGAAIPDNEAIPTSTHWHGTFCAEILVGTPLDNDVHGAAPQARLAVTQVLQAGNVGTVASITAGLFWLVDQQCDIVSLSLGWPGKHEEWAEPIRALLKSGVVVVAAVGNENGVPGEEDSRSPANYPLDVTSIDEGRLLSIGAHDVEGHVADFSGGEVVDWRNVTVTQPDGTTRPSTFAGAAPRSVPDMVGPGVDVVEPINAATYMSESGSSMAAPHIAGLIALILSALRVKDPEAKPRAAAELCLSHLKPLGPAGAVERSGSGRIDSSALFAALFGGEGA